MTHGMTRDEIRNAEIEAGRRAGERAARRDLFERTMKVEDKFKVMVCLPGHRYWKPGEYNIVVYVEDQEVWHGARDAPDFPPDELMAQLGLATQALDVVLPPPDPTHRVSKEGKEYSARLARINAPRWINNDREV
jgi:hypothetical protein